MNFSLIRSSAAEYNKKAAKTLEAVSDSLAEIETLTVSLIDAPFYGVTLTCLERAHVVTCFSGLTTTDVKLKPYRTHAEVSTNTWFLTPVDTILSE